MRAFAPKTMVSQKSSAASVMLPARAAGAPSRDAKPSVDLPSRLGHDFSRIPLHPPEDALVPPAGSVSGGLHTLDVGELREDLD